MSDPETTEALRLFDLIRNQARAEGAAAERVRILALLETERSEILNSPAYWIDGFDAALAAVRGLA